MAFSNPFTRVPVDEAGAIRKLRQQRDAELKPTITPQANTLARTAMMEVRKLLEQNKIDDGSAM
jgi:hypothetical protein|tara:strand:- start:518 stop:709 length:192 start_codon:yes stop_codon:yes gene_type:complete